MVKKSVLWHTQVSAATYRRSLDIHLQTESRNYAIAKLDEDLYIMKVSLNECGMTLSSEETTALIKDMEEKMKAK